MLGCDCHYAYLDKLEVSIAIPRSSSLSQRVYSTFSIKVPNLQAPAVSRVLQMLTFQVSEYGVVSLLISRSMVLGDLTIVDNTTRHLV